MDRDFIKAQIQDLATQEQMHFANWQRVQGAKFAYEQVLAKMDEEESHSPNGVVEQEAIQEEA